MKVKHYAELQALAYNSDSVKGITGRVLIGQQDGAQNFVMRVFEVEPGGYSPEHSHDWEHEIFFHQGSGELMMDGQHHAVRAGSFAFVPPGLSHQIRNTGSATMVFVCLIPKGPPEL